MFQKASLALCLFLFFGVVTHAQDLGTDPSESTTPPTNARYEIIQSPIAAKWTFRLDRHTGRVYQMVKSTVAEGRFKWEELEVIGLPQSPLDGKARYQIFTSGIAARYTLLLNVENGWTWQLMTDEKTGENYWALFR